MILILIVIVTVNNNLNSFPKRMSSNSTLPTPTSNVLSPQLWCVCVWEDYVDPCDCCGRGSRDRLYHAYSIVYAHSETEAKLHFMPRNDQKKVKVMATPYKIGKWMDEDDFFDFARDNTVNFFS